MTTDDAGPPWPFRVEDAQRAEVGRLLADGLLEVCLPGVVGPAGCTANPDARLAAAVLALPGSVLERGVVAQAAAAWLWCGGPSPAVIDVAVPPGRAVPRREWLAAHERRMPEQDITVCCAGGAAVRVTTPTRTLVDLLRLLPPGEAAQAAAPLVAVPGVTADAVAACLDRMRRARGVPRARTLAQSIRLPVIR